MWVGLPWLASDSWQSVLLKTSYKTYVRPEHEDICKRAGALTGTYTHVHAYRQTHTIHTYINKEKVSMPNVVMFRKCPVVTKEQFLLLMIWCLGIFLLLWKHHDQGDLWKEESVYRGLQFHRGSPWPPWCGHGTGEDEALGLILRLETGRTNWAWLLKPQSSRPVRHLPQQSHSS